MPVSKTIALALIDPPDIAMRSQMDDAKLQELAASIVKDGLIHPLSVRAKGERFEIIAGHRRFVACGMIGLDPVEVRDYTGEHYSPESIKIAENMYKEDVNPADTAQYLSELVERDKLNMDQLMAITGLSEPTINNYLDLFQGDQRIFEALRAGQIRIGHAHVLNTVKDEKLRGYFLQQTIDNTPPVNQLKNWIRNAGIEAMPATVPPADGAQETPPAAAAVVVDACELCDSNAMPWSMSFVRVHKHCLTMLKDAMKQGPQ